MPDNLDRTKTPVAVVSDSACRAKIREAQELVARFVPQEVSLVGELLAERRKEGARE